MPSQLPQLPMQSVPLLDTRGIVVDPPALLSRAWWLFQRTVTDYLSDLSDRITAVVASVNGVTTLRATQSQLAGLPGLFTGAIVVVTDYNHVLRWNGSGYEWGPGDAGSGMIQFFDVAPAGVGWKLIDGLGDDGSAIGASHPIKILNSDGTTRNNTTAAAMNVAAGVFIAGSNAYNGAVTAKTVPTVAAPVFTGASVTPTGTLGVSSSNITVLASSTTSAAAGNHSHNFTGNPLTPSGTNSAPAATLPAPPVDYVAALPYIRK